MKKIMFSDKFLLTKAVLDGRKTQTRRIVPKRVLDNIKQFQEEYYDATFDKLEDVELLTHYFLTEKRGKLPYDIGEVVAVAQSYKDAGFRPDKILYRSIPRIDGYKQETAASQKGWSNKMFVASNLMPHQIRITDVRVERLQDISGNDCLKEGVVKDTCKTYFNGYTVKFSLDQYNNILSSEWFRTPREAFAHLINKVSGKDVWSQNPYVFVYDFELVK